jgi:aminodeoxyfutalosine synthase
MVSDLEPKALNGVALTQAEAQRVLATTDLVSIGLLGEAARRRQHGDHVTFAQVLVTDGATPVDTLGEAAELRIVAAPTSIDDAVARVQMAAQAAGAVPITGFTMSQLVGLAGGDHLALADLARTLAGAGLAAVASLQIDQVDDPAELVRAVRHGGLGVWRITVHTASTLEDRLRAIEAVASLQAEVGGLQAFAPLPEVDPVDVPSTGYDDVRTVAVARLVCVDVPSIQVDWSLYGPKLAQVAIAYGANDLDRVSALDLEALGRRRSPREDIERQIRAAFATPVARDGRFAARA